MAIVNLPLYSLGVIWLNENNVVPVSIVDQSDLDVSGFAATGVNVRYNREGDSTNQTFSPSTLQWTDKGRGFYDLVIPASIINQEGCFEYLVEPVATGYKTFRGAGRIEQRPESRVLNAIASGFNTVNTIGNLLNSSAGYQCYAGGSYDATAQTLTFMAFLELNGQLVTGTTSGRVKVIDDSGATVMDILSAAPDANGMFKCVGTTIVLTAKKAYKVVVTIISGGITYVSGEMLQSFN